VTEHPATPEACVAKLREAGISYEQSESDRICGARYMAPLYDASREQPQDERACVDRFEFPNIPCTYSVVWVRAREAALLCEAEDIDDFESHTGLTATSSGNAGGC